MRLWSALAKLLRLQTRLYTNTFKHHRRIRKIGIILSFLILAGVGVAFGVGSYGFIRFIDTPLFQGSLRQSGVDIGFEGFVRQLPILILSGAFMMGLLSNISVLIQTLYLSGDMEYLLAAPIPTRAVFLYKLTLSSFPTFLLLGILTGPALVGLGIAQGYSIAFFALIPVFLFLLVTAGAGAAAVLVMVLVRIISPRRAAEGIAVSKTAHLHFPCKSGPLKLKKPRLSCRGAPCILCPKKYGLRSSHNHIS